MSTLPYPFNDPLPLVRGRPQHPMAQPSLGNPHHHIPGHSQHWNLPLPFPSIATPFVQSSLTAGPMITYPPSWTWPCSSAALVSILTTSFSHPRQQASSSSSTRVPTGVLLTLSSTAACSRQAPPWPATCAGLLHIQSPNMPSLPPYHVLSPHLHTLLLHFQDSVPPRLHLPSFPNHPPPYQSTCHHQPMVPFPKA